MRLTFLVLGLSLMVYATVNLGSTATVAELSGLTQWWYGLAFTVGVVLLAFGFFPRKPKEPQPTTVPKMEAA